LKCNQFDTPIIYICNIYYIILDKVLQELNFCGTFLRDRNSSSQLAGYFPLWGCKWYFTYYLQDSCEYVII